MAFVFTYQKIPLYVYTRFLVSLRRTARKFPGAAYNGWFYFLLFPSLPV